MGHLLKKHKEVSMPLFRITVKQSKNSNGIRIEKGMSVEVVFNSFSNTVITNGGQTAVYFDRNLRLTGNLDSI